LFAVSVSVVRTPGPRLNLTFQEAGQMIGCSYWTIRREVADGKLRVVKIRGLSMIPMSEIERYQQALLDEVDAEAAS
jgi:excisionase family DNA binding protein